MEIHHRNNSVNFGYLAARDYFDGSLSYFFLTSATNFGSWRGWIRRLQNRKVDHVVMKRALIMSSPGDRVYISIGRTDPRIVMENALFVKELYERASLETGDIIPIKGDPYVFIKKEAKHSAIATIIYDPKLHKIFGDEKLMDAVRILNDKVLCMDYFRSRGLDIPRSIHISRKASRAELEHAFDTVGFPCYIKSSQGAGGWGVWRVDDLSHAESILKRSIGLPFQIQEYLPGADSFNIQYLVLRDRVELILITKQRIKDDRLHMGNDWPAECPDLRYADRVAEACWNLGFLGIMALDMKRKLIEINPRQNSSGEMQVILERMSGVKNLSISIRHRKDRPRLKEMDLHHLWYDGKRGLLPFEWHDDIGEMSVAIINDLDGTIEARFREICPQM